MKFHVSKEPFDQVRDEAVAALNQNRSVCFAVNRFDWLYVNNPDGLATVWAVRTDPGGEMAGFTAALPRRVLVEEDTRICWNCADFSIHQQFRSLGAAIKLRRAAKDAVEAGQVDFLYAHPNARMRVVHQQVGHSPIGAMVRYSKFLRIKPILEDKLPTRIIPALAAPPLEAMMRLSGRRLTRPTCELQLEMNPHFDQRFDCLFRRAAGQYRVVGVRDAQYLNWRYTDNPLYDTHMVTAERGGELVGYALFTVNDRVAHVKDVFTADAGDILAELLTGLTSLCQKLTLDRISLVALEGNPVLNTARRLGFVRRPEVSTMFGHAPCNSTWHDAVLHQDSWYLTEGDRDQ